MGVLTATREELKDLFSSNLADFVKDVDIKSHLVSVLDSFVSGRDTPTKEVKPHSVIVNELYEEGKYASLVMRGDAYLFMCGWFPDYVSRSKNSPGMNFFIKKGIDSYEYALYLMHKSRIKEKFSVISKLGSKFKENINAIVYLKASLQGEVIMTPESMYELKYLTKFHPPNSTYIQETLVKADLFAKESLKERMAKRGISVIK